MAHKIYRDWLEIPTMVDWHPQNHYPMYHDNHEFVIDANDHILTAERYFNQTIKDETWLTEMDLAKFVWLAISHISPPFPLPRAP